MWSDWTDLTKLTSIAQKSCHIWDLRKALDRLVMTLSKSVQELAFVSMTFCPALPREEEEEEEEGLRVVGLRVVALQVGDPAHRVGEGHGALPAGELHVALDRAAVVGEPPVGVQRAEQLARRVRLQRRHAPLAGGAALLAQVFGVDDHG